ncbi:MAG: Carboxypeptidase, partial [Candidatus Woesebacteria bacterium GW2011_GWB1_41_10]
LRVEADEITYHFHIMLRFEIEKGLVDKKYNVSDVREIWNAKMKEYLGIVPKKDSEGVLQDIHWSQGMIGYFPTYSLGTFLAANWQGKDKKWLKEHIHKYGSTYTLQELLKKNQMKFDPSVNLDYLRKKYLQNGA